MSDVLTRYRQVDYALPQTYRSWDLFGAGLEHLGRDGKPVELPLRDPNPDEVLLRVDALGLCFSDTKLVWAGPEHPRIRGRDLANDPTVPGHEAALTVVKVGSDWTGKFDVGQRFIIQADIFVNGEQKAFGYVQRGAMAQFAYAGPWVLDGDDGCYLIPIQDSTGYAEAALVEPWACVENAYRIPARTAPKEGGTLLIVFAEPLDVDLTGLYPAGKEPVSAAVLGDYRIDLSPVLGPTGWIKRSPPTAAAVKEIAAEMTEGAGFDDVILVGKTDCDMIRVCDEMLAKEGHLAFVGADSLPATDIDIGRVHYHYTRHVGTTGMVAREAYTANDREEIKPGGAAWMVGAAGPMGQMHMQRALELDNPPAKLFATDISQDRLDFMQVRLQPLADKAGVEMVCRNVQDASGLDDALSDFTGGNGFDDIYVHAPVAPLVKHAAGFLATGAVLNVFAGVALGTLAELDPSIFFGKHTRLIGSSGSSMAAFTGVLEKTEAGRLATRMSLAALGSIEATWEGIKGVKENRFPGKTVIFPQISPLPLMEPAGLSAACSAAHAKLQAGDVWTNDAETALLEAKLSL